MTPVIQLLWSTVSVIWNMSRQELWETWPVPRLGLAPAGVCGTPMHSTGRGQAFGRGLFWALPGNTFHSSSCMTDIHTKEQDDFKEACRLHIQLKSIIMNQSVFLTYIIFKQSASGSECVCLVAWRPEPIFRFAYQWLILNFHLFLSCWLLTPWLNLFS